LFAGSANRILNRSGTTINHKDELAEYILKPLGLNLGISNKEVVGDMTAHISL
jgi:hypothetical protein